MRDKIGRSLPWLLSTLCAFSFGCAAEVGDIAAEDATIEDGDVGVVGQALAGKGEVFWIPPRGEQTLTIYYCFENEGEMFYGTNSVAYALNNTWEQRANINFVDEGDCFSAPHASTAVHIYGRDANGAVTHPLGKAVAGVVNGVQVPSNETRLRSTCGSNFPTSECFRTVVAHEFGHVLGFGHEHMRTDWVPSDCPDQGTRTLREFLTDPADLSNTAITAWDRNSLMEQGYCVPYAGLTLSTADIAGAAAIYGATNKPQGTAFVQFSGQKAIRFQINSRWLQPTDTARVNTQSFIGEWERVRINKLGSLPSDGGLRYGDEVSISDRWNRFMSGRDNNDVTMVSQRGDAERWRVETINESRYPTGSRVQVNAPLRLRNIRRNVWIGINSSLDVLLTTATSTSELRINGTLVTR